MLGTVTDADVDVVVMRVRAGVVPPLTRRVRLALAAGNLAVADDVLDPGLGTLGALGEPVGEVVAVEPTTGVVSEVPGADLVVAVARVVIAGGRRMVGVADASVARLVAVRG